MVEAPWIRRFLGFLVLTGSLLSSGCADIGAGVGVSDAELLAERAKVRWGALIEGDFAKAYGLESPGYRDTTPLRLYSSRFGAQLRWDRVEVLEVLPDETGEAATVRLMVYYTAMDPVGGVIDGQRPVEERWIKTGGEWWHIND